MLECVQTEVREVGGLRMPEDPEHAALFAELVHKEASSVRRYARAFAGSKQRSMAMAHGRSTSASGSSITVRPSIATRTRSPVTTPMRRAGTCRRAASDSNSASRAGATDTTARDADSEKSVDRSPNTYADATDCTLPSTPR